MKPVYHKSDISQAIHIVFPAICFLFCFNISNAVDLSIVDSTKSEKDFTLYGFYQYGWVLHTNEFLGGNNIQQEPVNAYRAAFVQLSVQTYGKNLWEQLYNFPKYSFGIYKPVFPDASYLGNPIAFYSAMSFPLKRWEKMTFNLDVGFGLSFNWRSYMEDKYNLAMGARESIIFSTAFSFEKKLNNGLIFNTGAGFVHFSNGALKVPNKGINIFTPRVGIGYNFNHSKQNFHYQEVPEFYRHGELILSVFTGWRNLMYYGSDVDTITMRKGVYYSCYGFSSSYNLQVSHKSKFGVGLMTDYLGYVNSSISVEDGKLIGHPATFRDGFEVSIYPSYELVISRASLILQPGFYLYRAKYPERTPYNYQRIGIKYYVTDDVSIALNMRAHYWTIADFIEWTVGISIF